MFKKYLYISLSFFNLPCYPVSIQEVKDLKYFMIMIADVVIAALIVGGVWGVNYLIPQQGIEALPFNPSSITPAAPDYQKQQMENISSIPAVNLSAKASDTSKTKMLQTKVATDSQDWHQKFRDKFTDQVVSTETSYTSPDVAIYLNHQTVDTARLDHSDSGKHEKYGTKISYVVADIYVGDITHLQTAFAQNTYGVGYSEKLSDMSSRLNAILAVNGDSYSNDRHKDNGTIIRNGIVYRAQKTNVETCVLNWDGTMKIYQPDQLNTQQLVNEGAYQSWIFGPSLLDENGKAKTKFLTWDYIRQSHPRTAIGYYEPGHYCLVCVDGRQDTSRGMFLNEMSQLFESLGCKAAYNLDGGHCTFMTKNSQIVNHPYKPDHEVPDGIFIV